MATFLAKSSSLSQTITSKNRVFRCVVVCTITLRNFTVRLPWCSKSQDSRSIRFARCCSNKNGISIGKKVAYWAKKLQKIGFLGVCWSALERFAIFLYEPNDAPTHRIDAQMNLQDVPGIKTTYLFRKNCVLCQKNVKKFGFFGSDITPLKRLVPI